MRIVGGSFGLSGKAFFSGADLVIDGAGRVEAKPEHIKHVVSGQESEKGWSVLSLLLGLLVLTPILWFATSFFFLGLVGLILGLWLTFTFSRTKSTSMNANVVFVDGRELKVEGSKRQINQLIKFSNQG